MAGREESRRAQSARLRRTDEVDVGSWFWGSEDCRNRDAKQGGCNCPAQDGISAHDVSPAGEFYFGGCSSPLIHPDATPCFIGSGCSQFSQRSLRGSLPDSDGTSSSLSPHLGHLPYLICFCSMPAFWPTGVKCPF